MSQLKFYAAAFAFAAALGVTAEISPAFAGPPGGHNDGGCRSGCNPTPPPTPPPAQGGNTNNNNNNNNATATANATGGSANAQGGNANAQGGNATGGTAYGGNATGGAGGLGGQGGQGGLGGQGGNSANNISIRNNAAANGGFINMNPEGCNQVRSAWIGTLPVNIGGGYSTRHEGCDADEASKATMGYGAQTGDLAAGASGIAGLASRHEGLRDGINQVGTVLAAHPDAARCADSAIQLLTEAAASRVLCRSVAEQIEAGIGQQQSIIVNVDGQRVTTQARPPLTCPAAQAAEVTALRDYRAATAAWTALAEPRRAGTSQETRYLETWRAHSNALIDRATACGPQTPGAS